MQDTKDVLATDTNILTFKLKYELEENIIYTLKYSFVTINGYTNFVEYNIKKNNDLGECPLNIIASQNLKSD